MGEYGKWCEAYKFGNDKIDDPFSCERVGAFVENLGLARFRLVLHGDHHLGAPVARHEVHRAANALYRLPLEHPSRENRENTGLLENKGVCAHDVQKTHSRA